MSLPIAYLAEAEDDIDAAYAYYEQLVTGLGDRFLQALQDRVNRIQDNPALYGIFYRDVRAAPLRRFPYVVYYRAEAQRVLIIAVQHGKRSLQGWKDRA